MFLDLCAKELAKLYGSENEEEVEIEEESETKESECDTKAYIRKGVYSEEELSEDELNGTEEIIRMHDGWCCIFVLLKCVESDFLWEINMIGQRKHILERKIGLMRWTYRNVRIRWNK